MLSIDNITIRFGGFELFSNIGFMINRRDRIGLVGKNGAGKSTLLKVICGIVTPTEGSVSKPSGITIGYLPQQMALASTQNTVLEETKKAFDNIAEIQREIDRLAAELETRTDYTSESYIKAAENLAHLNEHLQIVGVNNMEPEIERILKGLGFLRSDFNRKIAEFSGGWRMRVELAKILLQSPDLILLDEPTNHLDIESIQWLEDFLQAYKGAVLLISHDRAFLDNVTTRTIEINLGKLYDYKVPYSKFKVLQQERLQQQLAAYENQQKQIKDTEEFIERFRYKATKSNQVQSRIKQLEKMDIIEVDDLDNAAMHIKFAPAPRSGDIVVETKELSKSYGDNLILDKIDLVIERGEKVAFVGRNGEGKTTLSKVIIGETEYSGELKIGHNINIGYFAQNQDELLDPELTVFETLDRIAVGDIRTKIRDILGAFLFSGEDIDKKVKVLSGGEHSRLSLAKLLLQPYNLLVLDEPTNHLDIRSKDILKQALQNYDGTLIVVSHDRYFLDGLVSKVYEFKNKKIRLHVGGIYDFLRNKKIEDMREIEIKDRKFAEAKAEAGISDNKQKYLENKELNKRRRAIQNRIDKAEAEIERLESEIAGLNELMSNPAIEQQKLETAYKMSGKLNEELEQQMSVWEEASMEMEEFEKGSGK